MDVTRITQRWSRMTVLGLGTAAGLVFALPVETGSVACPPAREGRVNCLIQNAWAPAFVKVAAAVFITWLLADFLMVRVPAMLRRWRSGERLARRATDQGRGAVLADGVLAAASWGIVPEVKPAWRVVKPEPNPEVADALPLRPMAPAAECGGPVAFDFAAFTAPAAPEAPVAAVVGETVVPEPPAEVPVARPRFAGVRALPAAEWRTRGRAPFPGAVRVLDDEESRSRRLRRGSDPALVVSCWSDASSARALPDHVGV